MDDKNIEETVAHDGGQELEKREPVYMVESQSGHYGACYKIVQEKRGADPAVYVQLWTNIHQGLQSPYNAVLSTYWMSALRDIQDSEHNYKEHQLPLARIKKVMKADPEVKMISAEAPILFAKGCDIFITELTMRAWIHAEDNKRRTLQRSDIAAALTKSDMFDFLIDIVPREEATASNAKRNAAQNQSAATTTQTASSMPQQQGQSMQPPHAPQQQHHPQAHEYQQYAPPEQDPYRQQHSMYGHDPAYAHHPQAQMPYDPNAAMYAQYGMPPQQVSRARCNEALESEANVMQMYMPQMQAPRQDHPGPQAPPHYQQYDTRHHEGDAEGETEDVG